MGSKRWDRPPGSCSLPDGRTPYRVHSCCGQTDSSVLLLSSRRRPLGGLVALLAGTASVLAPVDRPQIRDRVVAVVGHADDVVRLDRIARNAGTAAEFAGAANAGHPAVVTASASGSSEHDLPVAPVRGTVGALVLGFPRPAAGPTPRAVGSAVSDIGSFHETPRAARWAHQRSRSYSRRQSTQ
jgi:hypothetical protein